ncbi:type IX secretion system plug protein [Terrimonas alba]|uniref:type IX secretion system plug protein n=1 Tax=Terrimonas alba TaxID=3349636 RepID=UPI0035F28135
MKTIIAVLSIFAFYIAGAQIPDHIYQPNIHTAKLHKYGDIFSYPIISLNSGEQLELHFDDFDADVKSYYYTFQLCNADWRPANLPAFDYIRGFQTTRITNYRYSSISFTKYTHYQAILPDRSSTPIRSGNYLLKVFLNSDTSKLYFTKRFLVVDNKVAIAAQLKQPFNSQLYLTDQRVQVVVNTANARINAMSPQDLKVTVLQNNIWPTAAMFDRPTIYRGNYYEYNNDVSSFQAGREWRWIDLRSLRLMSDRMLKLVDTNDARTEVYVKPDAERKQQVYVYYRDLNGIYTIENMDGNNPYWQSDYAYVHFTYMPPGGRQYPGKDIYIFGELTNYLPNEASRMVFNADKGVYEKTLYLKQGYYNYSYITLEGGKEPGNRFSFDNTEGNFTNTENSYTVLVYYRPFGARADELIGMAQLNTLVGR